MRFAFAHKLASYLMVGSAFLALALSSELLLPVVAIAAIGIIGSWWWESPRIDFVRYDRFWTVVSLLVLAYSIIDFLAGGDILLVGSHFLLYLVVTKLFHRRACKDYLHVYILAFLMLVAGTVLNSEFTFGLFFLCFVVSSTWALILFHLRRDMEENFLLRHMDGAAERVRIDRILASKRIVGKRFFLGTSLVSLTVFAGASLLFLAIPRIGIGFFLSKSRSGVTMAGFSDGVTLGGHGVIKDDNTVVMRIKVDGSYEGRTAPPIHWRGVAFDSYIGGSWTRSFTAPATRRHFSIEDKKARHYLLYDRPDKMFHPRRTLPGKLRQEIYLEPTGYDVLFSASMPHAFEFESTWRDLARKARNDEIRHPHSAGIRYVVYSNLDEPDVAALRKSDEKTEPPADFNHYLQIPDTIPANVRALAEEITADAPTSYDKAVAIESWLKKNIGYTVQMVSPGKREPIDFFLFERKQGHCEYFASAMAIMLRVVGVPTRNVNGFYGGEWNEYDDYIAVRAGDAHSWVEVYFRGEGWVTFDPTPSDSRDELGRGELGMLDRMRRWADTMRFKWFKWIVEYDLYQQMQLVSKVGQAFQRGGNLKEGAGGVKEWFQRNRNTVGAVILGALALAIGFILWRRGRGGAGGSGKSGRKTRARTAWSALYQSVLKRFAKRGYERAQAVTPREFALLLAKDGAPGARSMEELTELYYAAEYGGAREAEALARARSLEHQIELALAQARKQKTRSLPS